MAMEEDASYNGQPQNGSSQEYMSPPSNQLQYESTTKNGSQKMPAKVNPESYKDKSLDEILSQFVPFNTSENLSLPFEEEMERDKTFLHSQSTHLVFRG